MRPHRCSWLLSLLLASVACNQTDSVASILVVSKVDVSPPAASLGISETLQLEATPQTSGGIELPDREAQWTSSAPSIVSVSSTGLVQAMAAGGPVLIRATIDGVDGQAQISVSPVPVARVTVTPGQNTIPDGTTVQLVATAYDAHNAVLSGRSFVWQSSDPSVAPVTTDGLVIAQSDGGPVTISATTAGKSGMANVTVVARSTLPPETASGLFISTQPAATASAGKPFTRQPVIQLMDRNGNPVSQSGVAITAALASAPSQSPGSLGGTLTVSTVSSGAAVFTNLKISKSGIYTIKFTAPGLTPVTSTAILVL